MAVTRLWLNDFGLQMANDGNSSTMCNSTQVDSASCNYSNYMMDDEPTGFAMDTIVSIVVPILFGVIVVVGLFGNALVVIVVMCNPQMRSTTNLLIINLAVADLLFIVFCVPFTAWDYAFPHWVFGDVSHLT